MVLKQYKKGFKIMQTNRLKIVGLGRCIIGHLKKYLTENFPEEVDFKHLYLLNYNSCLLSNYSTDFFNKIKNSKCMPTFHDQLLCLDSIKDYDICAIEVFPPAPLYKHETQEVFACFEDYTQQLQELGFKKLAYIDEDYKKGYISTIEKLIEQISLINPKIKIILVNGEIVSEQKKYGSTNLYNMLKWVQESKLLSKNNIKLMDMNVLIETLGEKEISFFETAFPYVYIRHNHELIPIEYARDCKHATPMVREHFAKYFCDLIESFECSVPTIVPEYEKLDFAAVEFSSRAKKFLNLYGNSLPISEFENGKFLSLFISYTEYTNNKEAHRLINKYIKEFKNKEFTAEHLKDYFYHIRSLCAYTYSFKSNSINDLVDIAIKITKIPEESLSKYSNFTILWIKNIYLSTRAYNDIDSEKWNQFIIELDNNQYLNSFYEIKEIIKQLKSAL